MERQLLIGSVGLVRGRTKNIGPVMADLCDTIEPYLQNVNYTNNAPFKTISIIIRIGTEGDLRPKFMPIDYRHKELPVSIGVSMRTYQQADSAQLRRLLLQLILDCLSHVSDKFQLPSLPTKEIEGAFLA